MKSSTGFLKDALANRRGSAQAEFGFSL